MLEVINLIVGIAVLLAGIVAIILARLSLRGDTKSRRLEAEEKTIEQRAPKDADDLAKCVAALKGGADKLEPLVPREEFSAVLDDIPNRLVLVGLPGVGKSRIAVEAARRLQANAANRAIYYWDRFLPEQGGLKHLIPHRPILVIDDLQPGSGRNFAKHLEELLERIANESSRDRASVNVIITIWPAHEEWLRRELTETDEFTFIEITGQSRAEAYRYAASLETDGLFPKVHLSNEALSDLALCGSFGEILGCVKYFSKNGTAVPTAAQVQTERLRSWKDELDSFEPRERLLMSIIAILHQFHFPQHELTLSVVYRAAVRDEAYGLPSCALRAHGSRWFNRKWSRLLLLLRSRLIHNDTLCDLECRRIIRRLAHDRYVRAEGLVTSDKQEIMARAPGSAEFRTELRGLVSVFQKISIESSAASAREYWVPRLMEAGELLFKEGMFEEAIDLNKGLLEMDQRRLPRPANKSRSVYLHYIGFNLRNRDRHRTTAEEAADYFRRALEEDPKNVKAKHSLATYYYRDAHDYPKAVELYLEIVKENPTDWMTHKTLVEIYLSGLMSWDTVKVSHEALVTYWSKCAPGSLTGSIGCTLGSVAAARLEQEASVLSGDEIARRVESVCDIYRSAIERSTGAWSAGPHFYYGRFLYDVAGKPDEGIREMEVALDLVDKSYTARIRAGKQLSASILYRLASCYEVQAELRPLEAKHFQERLNLLFRKYPRMARFDPGPYLLHSALREAGNKQWVTLPEDRFWKTVYAVVGKFQLCLGKRASGLDSAWDSRVHGEAAAFLWKIERIARRRHLSGPTGDGLPTVRSELRAAMISAEHGAEEECAEARLELAKSAFFYGIYLSLIGDNAEAERCFQRAREANPRGFGHVHFRGYEVNPRIVIAKQLIFIGFPEKAVDLLKESLKESPPDEPDQPVAHWFLARAYEALYRLDEAFEHFWRAAGIYNAPTYYSQLRMIVNEWREPHVQLPPGLAVPHILGLRKLRKAGYRFKVLEQDPPGQGSLRRISEPRLRDDLSDFFTHCRKLKTALNANHWRGAELNRLMLQCSRRAYELDSEGKENPKNITDYADDLAEVGEFQNAKALFEKSIQTAEPGSKTYFALWKIGVCIQGMQWVMSSDAVRYFIRSAALEGTQAAYRQLQDKLRNFKGGEEQLSQLFLDVLEQAQDCAPEKVVEGLLQVCLIPNWNNGVRSAESADFVERLISIEARKTVREVTALAAIVLHSRGEDCRARGYFERLGDPQEFPKLVLQSYEECLQNIDHERSHEAGTLFGRRNQVGGECLGLQSNEEEDSEERASN